MFSKVNIKLKNAKLHGCKTIKKERKKKIEIYYLGFLKGEIIFLGFLEWICGCVLVA